MKIIVRIWKNMCFSLSMVRFKGFVHTCLEKSNDIEVSHGIVDDLHRMYISIKPNESIEILIECKKLEMTIKIKHHNLDKYGQNACGITTTNSIYSFRWVG
jgi:hypothetical protein